MEGKTARDKEVEERRDGRKTRSSGVRGTNPLSLHASLHAASSLYRIPPTAVLDSFFLHAVGEGRASAKTHWHTYRSFPFLRFEYHKTWSLALKAVQTTMQSRMELIVSQCSLRLLRLFHPY